MISSELNIYMKVLLESGYRYVDYGNDLPNPLILYLNSVGGYSNLPSNIEIYYTDEGDVFNIEFYKLDGYMNQTYLQNKIKIELRNNIINDLLEK